VIFPVQVAVNPVTKSGKPTTERMILTKFDKAVEIVLKHEGGLTDNPNDPGGLTNFGIAKKFYPDVDIASLIETEAREIYKRDYWDKSICEDLPEQLAINFFDSIVNYGIKGASKILQKATNKILSNANIELLLVDGIIGPKTLDKVMLIVSLSPELFNSYFLLERTNYYVSIANERKQSRTFLLGWLNRIMSFYNV